MRTQSAVIVLLVSLVMVSTPSPVWADSAVDVDSDWWARVQRGLSDGEYLPGDSTGGLQAPNRAHNLRTYFEPAGIRIQDRTATAGTELTSVSLVGLGRRGELVAVVAGKVARNGTRVEIRRPGLVEWYENGERGLEQGFTLQSQPQGQGPLVLELAVARARVVLEGESVVFVTEAGRRLRYGGLVATDAAGHALVSHLEVPTSRNIRLVVEDAGASYPVVIDPLLTAVPDTMLESNQADPLGFKPAAFGGSVASAGDVNGDGYADVVVSAPGWDGGDPQEGAVFVFLGSATGIIGATPATAHARIESNQFGAQLGGATSAGDVNGDGFDDIVVGAHFYDGTIAGGTLAVDGAAFVFHGGPAGITGTGPATADAFIQSNQLNSDLGLFVAAAGDVNGDAFDDIIVGVPNYGTPFPPNIPSNQRSGKHGAALVFHGGPVGINGTGFGDADRVLLSYEDTGAPQPTIYGKIGSVAGAGDVNGDGFDDVVLGGSQVAVFLGSAAGIVATDLSMANSRVGPGGPMGFDAFGFSAAGAGDVNGDGFADIVAGAPFRELVPFTSGQEGAVFVFHGSASGLVATDTTQANATFVGSLLAEWLGASVAGVGDVDGDGYDDVAISARVYPGSFDNEGVAYVLRGGPLGIIGTSLLDAYVRLGSNQAGAANLGNQAAFDVAGAGDVNGDGFADVIMGVGFYDAGQENGGAAFVYLGGFGCGINADCDNGLFCDGVETCDPAATCVAGTDPCPGQVCDELNDVCVNCQVDADCADGVFCNGVETCVAGACQAGLPIGCDDGVACTDDSCNEVSATCNNLANHATCDNGLFCDGVETCDTAFGCQAGAPPSCNDGISCTSDSCDAATDVCVYAVVVPCCGDGTCDLGEDCNSCAADCISGAAVAPGCGNGICETFAGENCKRCPADCAGKRKGAFCCGNLQAGKNPVGCDDARCGGAGYACSATPVSGSCCGDGMCGGAENVTTCAIDCAAGCSVDADCDDGLACNGMETCVAGACQAGTPLACNDGNACTADSCSGGICFNDPIAPCCGDAVCSAAESACSCQQDCGAPLLVEANCSDGVDDDCNGFTDCDDSDCSGNAACAVCKSDGALCSTNAQCCGGRCRQKKGAKICD